MNILIVEDDRWLRELYYDFLTHRGAQVQHTDDAQEAVDIADSQQIDCVILDMMLPLRSGVEIIHEMQSYADLSTIPKVILSTVHPKEFGGGDIWKPYGISAYLYKPAVTPSKLWGAINEVVERATSSN